MNGWNWIDWCPWTSDETTTYVDWNETIVGQNGTIVGWNDIVVGWNDTVIRWNGPVVRRNRTFVRHNGNERRMDIQQKSNKSQTDVDCDANKMSLVTSAWCRLHRPMVRHSMTQRPTIVAALQHVFYSDGIQQRNECRIATRDRWHIVDCGNTTHYTTDLQW
jgi:hypothetical protein